MSNNDDPTLYPFFKDAIVELDLDTTPMVDVVLHEDEIHSYYDARVLFHSKIYLLKSGFESRLEAEAYARETVLTLKFILIQEAEELFKMRNCQIVD